MGINIVQGPTGSNGFTGGDQLNVVNNPIQMAGVHLYEAPRFAVVVNGYQAKIHSYTITWNAHGILDTADFDVPIVGNPDWSIALFQNETDTSPVPVTIYAGFINTTDTQGGFPGVTQYNQTPNISQMDKRFVGQVDNWNVDFKSGVVKFQCRSLGAILGDRRLTTPVKYQTSLQMIQAQCAAVGLAVKALIPGAPVQLSTVFSREFVSGVKNFRVWDLILQCSQFDDTDVWVDGNTLYYMAPYLADQLRTTVNLELGRDLENLEVTHSPQYNRKIRVEVRSYVPQSRTGTLTRLQTLADGTVVQSVISRTSTSSPVFGTTGVVTTSYAYNQSTGTYTQTSGTSVKTGGGFNSTTSELSDSGLERYIYYKAGLSPQDNLNLARNLWRYISMHEYAATLTMPVRSDLFPYVNRLMLINLSGSPFSKFNQKYWPRKITETVDLQAGARWSIEAVNHQPPLGQGTS